MYDVIYLGSGHACWHGAVTLSAAGKKVAILDHDVAGGTCTNYGCDAKILLDGPFEFAEGLERYKDICVDNAGDIDWKKLMEYKKRISRRFLLCSAVCLNRQALPLSVSAESSLTRIPYRQAIRPWKRSISFSA